MWKSSLVPDTYDIAAMGYPDWGGGPVDEHAGMHHGTPVKDLVADPDRPADVRETLTVRVKDGHYTVNGTSPGPTIEAAVGQLIEVRLVNDNVADGITLHWHGVDVPNAEDGVAGVTQDAVGEGEEHVYRFVAEDAGTYWYHSHQVSHEQVRRGLLGALVIRPEAPDPGLRDYARSPAPLRRRADSQRGGGRDDGRRRARRAGPAQGGQHRQRSGVALDDRDRRSRSWPWTGSTSTSRSRSPVSASAFRPEGGSTSTSSCPPRALASTSARAGSGVRRPTRQAATGRPCPGRCSTCSPTVSLPTSASTRRTPTGPSSTTSASGPGFVDGRPGMWWTINGHLFPDVPMFMVEEGDVVVFRINNDSDSTHPMHLHGHHAVVLSRNGKPATGSPWVVDSLEVPVGDSFEIAFVADNPGIWMDHCHNLRHAAEGLVAHLMYTGVESSYLVGGKPGNQPE